MDSNKKNKGLENVVAFEISAISGVCKYIYTYIYYPISIIHGCFEHTQKSSNAK